MCRKNCRTKPYKIVDENLIKTSTAIIKKHFGEKGFLNTTVTIKQRKDPGDANSVILDIKIDKHKKVMISDVTFEGNKDFSQKKLRKYLSKKPAPGNFIIYSAPANLSRISTTRTSKT